MTVELVPLPFTIYQYPPSIPLAFVRAEPATLSLVEGRQCWYTVRRPTSILPRSPPGDAASRGGMFLTRIGGFECLIVLIVLLVVIGLAFRTGHARGKGRK